MTSFASFTTAIAIGVLVVSSCRGGGPTPRPSIIAEVVGDHRVEGLVTAESSEDGHSASIVSDMGSGNEWGVTIRAGTCQEPGPIKFTVGPIENGFLARAVDASLRELAGLIVVITPLGVDEIVSCGTFGG